MKISLQFGPGPRTLEYAQHAEALGFHGVWLHDSPPLYWDPWITLHELALGTSSINIGVATALPSNRHVMTAASSLIAVAHRAPGRVRVALGTGYTGRAALGEPADTWKVLSEYTAALRDLLAGKTVEYRGRMIACLHNQAPLPNPPIPIALGAIGPKGTAIARELGDGIVAYGAPQSGFDWSMMSVQGTVLDPGESFEDDAVFARIAAVIALFYHVEYSAGRDVDLMPGGRAWRESLEAIPQDVRHMELHRGHMTHPPDRELPLLDRSVGAMTFSGTVEEIRRRADELEAGGVTELLYAPMGNDLHREIEAMARALLRR